MADAKCIICGTRKGRRFCLDLRGMVCAPCCGKRMHGQSGCPEECVYVIASRQYHEQKDDTRPALAEADQRVDWAVVAFFEESVYERLLKDSYYEDRDILQGIERKIDALEHRETPHEVLLNRVGVIESALDQAAKRIEREEGAPCSDERLLRALHSYARMVRRLGTSRKAGHRYIDNIKERVAQLEKKQDNGASKKEDMPGHSLITLPFGK
ncbi:MAG: hypothetical protein ACMUIS_02675 [bacterium]